MEEHVSDMFNRKQAKSALESLLFVWGSPLPVKAAAEACGINEKRTQELLAELKTEYEEEGRGILLRRIGDSFQFITKAENAPYIENLCRPVKVKKLSRAAVEVLAIVAYKQPVTRAQIDGIRGVKSERILDGLIRKDLIEEKGRSEGIGRPLLYGTTDTFLRQFDLESTDDLPRVEERDLGLDANEEEEEDSLAPAQLSIESLKKTCGE